MSQPIQCPDSLMPLLCRWSRMTVGLEAEPVESLPDLGIDLLTAGYGTEEIMALAVCDLSEHPADLRQAARRAFASLGVPDEEDREFHLMVAGRSVASRIVDGTLSPEEGRSLMAAIWTNTHYPKLLSEWIIVEEATYFFREIMGTPELYTGLTEATISETIRTLAKEFLSENQVILHPP
ncbi:MAG: hypothetical protein JWM59_512 [Verrucomicrobiales bacterium]|nr:hypothetical protein [Verrucomicrobiales bacterium]